MEATINMRNAETDALAQALAEITGKAKSGA